MMKVFKFFRLRCAHAQPKDFMVPWARGTPTKHHESLVKHRQIQSRGIHEHKARPCFNFYFLI